MPRSAREHFGRRWDAATYRRAILVEEAGLLDADPGVLHIGTFHDEARLPPAR